MEAINCSIILSIGLLFEPVACSSIFLNKRVPLELKMELNQTLFKLIFIEKTLSGWSYCDLFFRPSSRVSDESTVKEKEGGVRMDAFCSKFNIYFSSVLSNPTNSDLAKKVRWVRGLVSLVASKSITKSYACNEVLN